MQSVAGGHPITPLAREGARDSATPPKARGAPPRPRGGIRILEGHENQSQQSEVVGSKGKEKVGTRSRPPSPSEKPTSPPSLEAVMSDPSLFEELPLESPNKEEFSLLGTLYGGEAVRGARVVEECYSLQNDCYSKRFLSILYSYIWVFLVKTLILLYRQCRLACSTLTWPNTMTGSNTNSHLYHLCEGARALSSKV